MQEFMATNYVEMPFDIRSVTLFRRYFETLASGNGAMLIHCAAGKDRTGILAWLTHRALGVHRDDALEDFSRATRTKTRLNACDRGGDTWRKFTA